MPSCREYSERYTSRPSPPFNARHFASGSSKKGNDGKTYIVSRPSVNGVKRWVKKSSAKKRNTRTTPLRRMYPRPVHRSGHLESARASEQRRIANAQREAALRIRPSGSAVTQLPPRPRRLPPMITLHEYTPSSLIKYGLTQTTVTFTPYFSRPAGNKWIFYDKSTNQFRHQGVYEADGGYPAHGANWTCWWEDTQHTIDVEGYKVWVVDQIPDFWEEQ